MARYSNGTAGWKLANTNINPLQSSSGPFTIVFWFKSGDTSQSNVYICHSLQTGIQIAIIYEFVNDTIEFYAAGYADDNPRTDSGITAADTNWHHIAYRKDASGSSNWDKFLDGSKTNIGTKDFTFGAAEDFYLFAGSFGNELDGSLFDFAIYESALTDAEIAILAKGFSTRFLGTKPDYGWELFGRNSPEPDIYNSANNLTVTNVIYADNPRIIQPYSPFYSFPSAGAPPAANIPEFMKHYRMLRAS